VVLIHSISDLNALTGFPSSWAHLSQTLVTISLHRNKLTTFELSTQLPALKELNLSNNQIQNINITDSNLAPSLMTLNVNCNRLKDVPSNLTKLFPALTTLLANTNKISAIEPSSFEGIRVLDLGNNDIAQVPPMLGRVISIKDLNLGGNW
jgi:Leucine-rich repeat (LRR) protein